MARFSTLESRAFIGESALGAAHEGIHIGASYPIYPLGATLISEINGYIKSCGKMIDRFDYEKNWPAALAILENSPNPLLHEAFHTKNLEQIMTALDLAELLHEESLAAVFKGMKQGGEQVDTAAANHQRFSSQTEEYRRIRRIMLWAMEAFFLHKHQEDLLNFDEGEQRSSLKRFADTLRPGESNNLFDIWSSKD